MTKRNEEEDGIAMIVAGCKLMRWVIAVPRGVDDVQYLVIGEEQIVGCVDEILSRQMNPVSGEGASVPRVPKVTRCSIVCVVAWGYRQRLAPGRHRGWNLGQFSVADNSAVNQEERLLRHREFPLTKQFEGQYNESRRWSG